MDAQLIRELEELGGEIRPSSLRECDEIIIDQPSYTARIALWGGHLVSFVPTGQADLLFQSENEGAQTRFGRRHFGVPVCWPWFGANTEDDDLPAHGLARYFRWQLVEVGRFKNGDAKIVIRLASEDHPLIEEMWPHAFELRQVFRLGEGFSINFSAANLSDKDMSVSEALHTYFHIGDNQTAQVHGLDGVTYVDKFDEGQEKTQKGVVSPCEELDRVYLDAPEQVALHDPILGRKLIIESEGARSKVLWNPGEALAKLRADMEEEDYRRFVCIETANALSNAYKIKAGEMHQLRFTVHVASLEQA
ncbi:Putative glucose-6-phosphate 1-epimerase [Marinomonas aquimarina]|uniref:Putative glucose-6-phosphate 1-epimerase n=1 Tax=Marinomonas aquimarina TaxID=295068 RepID=A0A1A8TJY5_9GAMM|nr:D-hexose-6-phosphate mutarotase [Marinomonas aquimarina]SBS32899.1 Putative glucose-6-phosphate 1-epimerase [Marinomonas aquimarina]